VVGLESLFEDKDVSEKGSEIAGENNLFGCLPTTTIEAGGMIHCLWGEFSLQDPAWAALFREYLPGSGYLQKIGSQMGEELEREVERRG
jgi:hypothetical protein